MNMENEKWWLNHPFANNETCDLDIPAIIAEAIRRHDDELREKIEGKLRAFGITETDPGIAKHILSTFNEPSK